MTPELRQQYALAYIALNAWRAPDARGSAVQAKLLVLGKVLGTGAVTLGAARQIALPVMRQLTGIATNSSITLDGLMQLWILAARRVMQSETGLSGLAGMESLLEIGPFICIGAGVVLLLIGFKHGV